LEEFIFHNGPIPWGYIFSFTESLFNQHDHRKLQAEAGWNSFYILHQKTKIVKAGIHFHLENGIAKSPFRATFGGFDLAEGIQPDVILNFVIFIERQLKELGAAQIFIKLPLRISSETDFTLIEKTLIDRDFQIRLNESGCILKVDEYFYNNIHTSERSYLNKSIRNGFEFMTISLYELESVYSFLQRCHTEKKYELSMAFSEIQYLASVFPDQVFLFGVKDNDQLIAASICIRINQNVLYDFYHNHDAAYTVFSPIVFLIKGINDYAIANHIPLIDLGTAMVGDKVNTGLMEFKLKLGGERGVKYSFEKRI
jgi:hypothetical protein